MRDIRGPRLETREVGNIDDLAFRAPQMRNRTLRHEKRRSQIEVERRIPAVRRDVLDRLPHHDRRRVDHDIEPFENARSLVGESPRGVRIGQVRLHQLRATAGATNRAHRLLGTARGAVVMHRHVTPCPRQPNRDGLSDAPAGARHQCARALEPH